MSIKWKFWMKYRNSWKQRDRLWKLSIHCSDWICHSKHSPIGNSNSHACTSELPNPQDTSDTRKTGSPSHAMLGGQHNPDPQTWKWLYKKRKAQEKHVAWGDREERNSHPSSEVGPQKTHIGCCMTWLNVLRTFGLIFNASPWSARPKHVCTWWKSPTCRT